jgi:hypothetical protein
MVLAAIPRPSCTDANMMAAVVGSHSIANVTSGHSQGMNRRIVGSHFPPPLPVRPQNFFSLPTSSILSGNRFTVTLLRYHSIGLHIL